MNLEVETAEALDALGQDIIVVDHQGEPWRHSGDKWWIGTSGRDSRWLAASKLGPFTIMQPVTKGPQVLDFPRRIDITTETYGDGTRTVLTEINGIINSGAVAAVYVQPLEAQ